ncbi:hypothetical protein [Lyngbya sp. CCY1209]|uniref:hypothetical protein n=1 Tax=Lyngbya sp. CCY1209 TaxID=2886103 RepID=UPI002D216E16|nr:hypothetical protein [Lyngbya sp. CCY1209]MEB3885506.1 hypothetical protein [Lyngbya sp. CCY1209]
MALDISFYSQDINRVNTIDISDDFYEWLAKSEFSKIGVAEKKDIEIDGEPEQVDVVVLDWETRRKYSDFFRDEIVKEGDKVLEQLGDSPSKEEYSPFYSRLKLLQDLRKQIENETIKYLGRLE